MCRFIESIFENMKGCSFSKNSGTSDTVNADLTFSPLTPTDEAKDCESYMGALSWALSQDKIHNIAISGPYGSGKSAIIQTLMDEYDESKGFHYLPINMQRKRQQNKEEETLHTTNFVLCLYLFSL